MKKISLIIFTIITSLLLVSNVEAASASISVTTNKSRVIVGETVTVTVKVSSSVPLGSWQFDVQGSSHLTYTSSSFGGQTVKDVTSNGSTYSKSYTFSFKAKSSGSASVSVVNPRVLGFDTTDLSVAGKSVSFTTMTQSELEATYSKNNNLSSLSVEGHTLTPEFNKDVLEYALTVENEVKNVTIIATEEDSKASVSGTGMFDVIEGVNPLKVVVTAQNGTSKTYTVNVTVKELAPINVDYEGSSYTVVRKDEFFPQTSIFFEKTTVTINGEIVPASYNLTNDITLVALKDEVGEIVLFEYSNNTYTKYNEVAFNQLHIIPKPFKEQLEGYESVSVKIGEQTVLGYKKEGYDYYLINGLNLETGEENIYSYDETEKTIQRYFEIKDDNSLYLYAIIGLTSFIVITYIVIIITSHKRKKSLPTKSLESNKEIDEFIKKSVPTKKDITPKPSVEEAPAIKKETPKPKVNNDELNSFIEEVVKKEKKVKSRVDKYDLGKTMIDIGRIKEKDNE